MQARKPFQAASRYPRVEYTPPRQMIPALKRAVTQMNHSEIKTVQALLVRAVGDFTAGMVLYRLLEWLPFSKREDGGIWKSDRDWSCELGLTYTQMSRVRRKLAGVVTCEVKRAQGSPTYHYWLDADALMRKIAEVYECTILFAKVMIYVKSEIPFSGNMNMEVQETSTSIFGKPEKPEQDKQQKEKQQERQQEVQTAFSFPAVIDLKTANLWDAVKNQLEHQLDRATWKYVKGAVGELRGDELVLRGTHPHDLLRASRNIAKIASSIANKKITVRIEE
jgi:hypothetical protein